MLGDFLLLGGGLALLTITVLSFWAALPKEGAPPRQFIGTALEPLIAVGITAGLVMGVGLMVAGIVDLAVVR